MQSFICVVALLCIGLAEGGPGLSSASLPVAQNSRVSFQSSVSFFSLPRSLRQGSEIRPAKTADLSSPTIVRNLPPPTWSPATPSVQRPSALRPSMSASRSGAIDPNSPSPVVSPTADSVTTTSSGGTSETTAPFSAVDIDGSLLPIPATIETISWPNGQRLTLGPSGIFISGTFLPVPSGTVASVVDGLTLKPAISVPSSTPSAKASDVPVSVPRITPPPSGSPGYISDTIPAAGLSQPGIAVTFDDETYVLPFTSSIELLQSDGRYISLLSDAVVSGTATVSLSSITSQTSLSLGSLPLEVGPQPRGSPATGGSSGFGGLINAFKGLAGSANSISDTLGKIGEQGVLWAGGQIDDSSFAGGIGSLLDSATSDMSQFVSTMSSTLEDFSAETYEMTEDGLRRVFTARTGAVEELDLLKSLRKLTRGLTHLRNDAVQQVKNYWKQGTAAAAALAAAEEALRKFGSYDWAGEVPKSSSSSFSTSTSTQSGVEISMEEESTTSSTTTSTTTSTPTPYILTTKPGTSLSDFQFLIKGLPDGGNGEQIVFEQGPWQYYVTNLTSQQADGVAAQESVKRVSPVNESADGDFGARLPSTMLHKRVPGRQSLQQRRNSANQLNIISADRASHEMIREQPDQELPFYLHDPMLGQDQTIYVLDSGYNIAHPEFGNVRGSQRTVETKVAPNSLTLLLVSNQDLHAPETVADYTGHGTFVASVAAGNLYGVASKANLVLVKFKNAAENPVQRTQPPNYKGRGVTDPALAWAWSQAIDDVVAKRQNGHTGQFIINMSYGFDSPNNDEKGRILEEMLSRCWELDIITVVPTGNAGGSGGSLDLTWPQRLGTFDNGLITVGGVDRYGMLAPRTTFDAGKGGSISLYALSEGVTAAKHEDSEVRLDDGTSFAAPAVAGLAAYFASLPSLRNQWTTGSVSTAMKKYLVQYATSRADDPIPAGMRDRYPDYVIPPANSVKVAYNRVREGLCGAEAPNRRGLTDSADEARVVNRQDSPDDVDVVVSGTIVASSLIAPYCAAPSSLPTDAVSSTTSTSSTTTHISFTIPPPSTVGVLTDLPTLSTTDAYCTEVLSDCRQILHSMTVTGQSCTYNTECNSEPTTTTTATPTPSCPPPAHGQVTDMYDGTTSCGPRSDQNNPLYWFTTQEAFPAIREFCGNMTQWTEPFSLGPEGTLPFQWGRFTPPGRPDFTLRMSATYGPKQGLSCPTTWWSNGTDFDASWYNICYNSITIPLQNCDTAANGNEFWKQGGTFFDNKRCTYWKISSEVQDDIDNCRPLPSQDVIKVTAPVNSDLPVATVAR